MAEEALEKAAEKAGAATAAERWTTASSGVREAAKWLATAVGSTAGVVLGAGPIINADADVSEWGPVRWILVLALAALSALAAGRIIALLLTSLVPVEVTLDQLPPGLSQRLKANQLGEYLPGGVTSLAQFKDRLISFSRAAAQLEAAAAEAADPTQKARLTALAKIQADNRDRYLAKRAEIYALAKYEIESGRLISGPERQKLAGWLVTAAVALTAFTFSTAAPADDKDESATSPAPTGALLTQTPATADLWKELRLGACVTDPTRKPATVPVMLLSASEDGYRVQTLGTPAGCGRYVFTLDKEHVDPIVVEPTKVTIKDDDEDDD